MKINIFINIFFLFFFFAERSNSVIIEEHMEDENPSTRKTLRLVFGEEKIPEIIRIVKDLPICGVKILANHIRSTKSGESSTEIYFIEKEKLYSIKNISFVNYKNIYFNNISSEEEILFIKKGFPTENKYNEKIKLSGTADKKRMEELMRYLAEKGFGAEIEKDNPLQIYSDK